MYATNVLTSPRCERGEEGEKNVHKIESMDQGGEKGKRTIRNERRNRCTVANLTDDIDLPHSVLYPAQSNSEQETAKLNIMIAGRTVTTRVQPRDNRPTRTFSVVFFSSRIFFSLSLSRARAVRLHHKGYCFRILTQNRILLIPVISYSTHSFDVCLYLSV